jgi:hypothetical protein
MFQRLLIIPCLRHAGTIEPVFSSSSINFLFASASEVFWLFKSFTRPFYPLSLLLLYPIFEMPSTHGLPEFSLVNKVILVSGAAQGLGLTQAEALLEAGAKGTPIPGTDRS